MDHPRTDVRDQPLDWGQRSFSPTKDLLVIDEPYHIYSICLYASNVKIISKLCPIHLASFLLKGTTLASTAQAMIHFGLRTK